MFRIDNLSRLTVLLVLALLLSGCASIFGTPAEQQDAAANHDPLEPWNRRVFDNNYFFDRLLFRPLAELYRATIPPGMRHGISGVVGNMKEPVVLVNDLLQGEFDKAGTTIERFGINTTVGIGGIWDVASDWGLEHQSGDFGQTLASWGVGAGPYLMLPLFGPSNFRDAAGIGADLALSPWPYVAWQEGGTVALERYEATTISTDSLLKREKNIEVVDNLRSGSVDFYVKLRSVYRQYRNNQLGHEETP